MRRSDELAAIIHESEDTYAKGYEEGLRAFAWMRDGTLYVGTTDTTFEQALERFLADRGYQLPRASLPHERKAS
jgi:hypothetical protein